MMGGLPSLWGLVLLLALFFSSFLALPLLVTVGLSLATFVVLAALLMPLVSTSSLLPSSLFPEVSPERLEEAEAALLATIASPKRSTWRLVQTQHASWHLHSVQIDCTGRHRDTRRHMVVLHGHSAGVGHWECVCDRLSKEANLHLLSLPGWGRSPWPKELRGVKDPVEIMDLHVEMLRAWMQEEGLSSATILGHSFGSMVAVHFATRYPGMVQKLILASPAGLLPVMPASTYLFGFYFRFLTPQRLAWAFGRIGCAVFRRLYLAYSNEDPRFADYYYQLAASTARLGSADGLFARFVRYKGSQAWWSHPVLSMLLALPHPLTVIWGEKDPLLPASFAGMIHRLRPSTDVNIIRNAKHNPAHSRADAFARCVVLALKKPDVYAGAAASPATDPTDPTNPTNAAASTIATATATAPLPEASSLSHCRSSGAFMRHLHHHAARGPEEGRAQAPPTPVVVGKGPGFCNACGHEVHLFKAYWRCSCGAWSFTAHWSQEQTRRNVEEMLAFLDDLHLRGTFDARQLIARRGAISVRSPYSHGPLTEVQAPPRPASSLSPGELLVI